MDRSVGDIPAVKNAVMSVVVLVAVAIVLAYIRDVRAQHEWWLERTRCSAVGVYDEAVVETAARGRQVPDCGSRRRILGGRA